MHADPVGAQVRPGPPAPPPPPRASSPRPLTRSPAPARSFLHACSPPIIHGNLTSDTIFIQHNGLIKIGSGAGRSGSGDLRGRGPRTPAAPPADPALSPPCPAQCGTASSPTVRGGPRGWRAAERAGPLTSAPLLALPDDLRSPIRAEREELRNLHFFPPEYGGESPREAAPQPPAPPRPAAARPA